MLHSFEWVSIIPGLRHLPVHVAHTILVVGILCIVILLASRKLRRPDLDLTPSPRLNLVTFFELLYESIYKLTEDILGHHTPKFLYLVSALAMYILFSNLFGLIPGFAPPTDNVNTTAACALVVFFATHYYGVKMHGIKYLKHFAGPVWWLAPLMIPIEIISHLARPLSLSIRLFGNMFGDHMVFSLFVFLMVGLTKAILGSHFLLWVFSPIAPLIPILIVVFGIFVACIQTLVFVLLTMSYISGAVAEAH